MSRPINNIRKLTQVGRNSVGLMLPAGILRDLGWHKHQKVLVKRVPRGILIRDALTKHR